MIDVSPNDNANGVFPAKEAITLPKPSTVAITAVQTMFVLFILLPSYVAEYDQRVFLMSSGVQFQYS